MKINKNKKIIFILSLIVQLILGIFLGHIYDTQVAMAAGYFVGSGLNPYQHLNLRLIFSHFILWEDVPAIGYPPLSPILYGVLYYIFYKATGNMYVYFFSLKVPIIISNLLLSIYIWNILREQTSNHIAENAMFFVLFNPFILYTTTAWGQIDSIIALLCLFSLNHLYKDNVFLSTLALAISLSLKPLLFPLIPLIFLYLYNSNKTKLLYFITLLVIFSLLFIVFPFLILNWSPELIFTGWNSHFILGGGLGYLTFLELTSNSFIPNNLSFLGYLWIPALLFVYSLIDYKSINTLNDLLENALIIMLTFFLTRAWVSEPNLVVVIILVLILSHKNNNFNYFLKTAWVLPLIFTFFNASLPQMLYLYLPNFLNLQKTLDFAFYQYRILFRSVVVFFWQLISWRFIYNILYKKNHI